MLLQRKYEFMIIIQFSDSIYNKEIKRSFYFRDIIENKANIIIATIIPIPGLDDSINFLGDNVFLLIDCYPLIESQHNKLHMQSIIINNKYHFSTFFPHAGFH